MQQIDVPSGGVAQSTVRSELVDEVLERYYGLSPYRSTLWHKGWNDTYRTVDHVGEVRYFVRIGSVGKYWLASPDDAEFELSLLDHLAASGATVARPLLTLDGSRSLTLLAPEGPRPLVVFLAAEGHPKAALDLAMARVTGVALARVHRAMGTFEPLISRRHVWDVSSLVESSIGYLEASIIDPAVRRRVLDVVERAGLRTRSLERSLDRGWIHGDAHRSNWILHRRGAKATLVDFDHCGWGWPAYDVASFVIDLDESTRRSFLEGYLEAGGHLPSPVEQRCLEATRKIWLRAEILRLGRIWGIDWAVHADWSGWATELAEDLGD